MFVYRKVQVLTFAHWLVFNRLDLLVHSYTSVCVTQQTDRVSFSTVKISLKQTAPTVIEYWNVVHSSNFDNFCWIKYSWFSRLLYMSIPGFGVSLFCHGLIHPKWRIKSDYFLLAAANPSVPMSYDGFGSYSLLYPLAIQHVNGAFVFSMPSFYIYNITCHNLPIQTPSFTMLYIYIYTP